MLVITKLGWIDEGFFKLLTLFDVKIIILMSS